MSTAGKINKMLEAYISSNEGKEKIARAVTTSASIKEKREANFEEAVRVLKECICNYAPPGLAADMPKMIDGLVTIVHRSYDGSAYVDISFNPSELTRLSLNPKSEKYAYDIIGLFTQGYEIIPIENNHKRVFGKWHGVYTLNKMYREPNDFIWRAVKFFETTYAKEYGVEHVFIENELYW